MWSSIYTKRGGICIYHEDGLPVRYLNIFPLKEALYCELDKCFNVTLYRSPNQTSDEFSNFLIDFDLTIDHITKLNPDLILVLGVSNQ